VLAWIRVPAGTGESLWPNLTDVVTGPRPPSRAEQLLWPGPRRRKPRSDDMSPQQVIDQLTAELGDGRTLSAQSQVLADAEILKAFNAGQAGQDPQFTNAATAISAATGDTDIADWLAGALGVRAWAMSRAVYNAGATPVFAETMHLLVPGTPGEVGDAIRTVIRQKSSPDPGKVADLLGRDLAADWRGYAVLAMLVEATIDELAMLLDDWDQPALWGLVYPGMPAPLSAGDDLAD
jgi:hypothetical protein